MSFENGLSSIFALLLSCEAAVKILIADFPFRKFYCKVLVQKKKKKGAKGALGYVGEKDINHVQTLKSNETLLF